MLVFGPKMAHLPHFGRKHSVKKFSEKKVSTNFWCSLNANFMQKKIRKNQGANSGKRHQTDRQTDEQTNRAKFTGPSGWVWVQKVRKFLELKSWYAPSRWLKSRTERCMMNSFTIAVLSTYGVNNSLAVGHLNYLTLAILSWINQQWKSCNCKFPTKGKLLQKLVGRYCFG